LRWKDDTATHYIALLHRRIDHYIHFVNAFLFFMDKLEFLFFMDKLETEVNTL